MTKLFHEGLERMTLRVQEMGSMARRNLAEGLRALQGNDAPLAQAVVRREAMLNRMDVEIEKEALDLLALNQPMAQDLRTVGASMKLITYIDRIGRYGYDMAKIVLETDTRLPAPLAQQLGAMGEAALGMVDLALDSYRQKNADMARQVAARDDVVDRLYDDVVAASVAAMKKDPGAIDAATQAILVARHLERAGDNAQKIAEKTLYMVTGERRTAE